MTRQKNDDRTRPLTLNYTKRHVLSSLLNGGQKNIDDKNIKSKMNSEREREGGREILKNVKYK